MLIVRLQYYKQSRRQSSRRKGAKRLLGGPKFEIWHKSRCVQKNNLVDWEEPNMSIGGGQAPLVPPLGAGPDYKSFDAVVAFLLHFILKSAWDYNVDLGLYFF